MKKVRMKDEVLYEALKKVVPDFERKLRSYADELGCANPYGLELCWEVQVGPEQNDFEIRSLHLDPNMFETVDEKKNIILKLESEEAARGLYDVLLKAKEISAEKEDSPFKDVRSIELAGDER